MFKKIITISRPRFWLYIFGPFLIGIAALTDPQQLSRIDVWYGLFFFFFPANVFIYTVNDYCDRSIDDNNPKKNRQEISMNPQDKTLYIVLITGSLLASVPLLLINQAITFVVICFLLLGFFYSSPPLRFKTVPVLDSLSNILYILPGIIGFLMVTNTFPPLTLCIAAGLWAIAMHLFSAIVDIVPDTKANIVTSATALGYKKSLLVTSILWSTSFLLALPYSPYLIFFVIYPLLPLITLWKQLPIAEVYWRFPVINAFLGFVLFWLVVLYG